MKNIHQLLNSLTADENNLRAARFLAPCVKGGKVRTRLSGLVYTFTPKVRTFEGWGIFQPLDAQTVEQVDEAELPQIDKYLGRFLSLRLRLMHRLRRQSWLAYPANAADMRQQLGWAKPVVVHLVTEGGQFDQVVARWDGAAFCFESLDRRAEFMSVEQLRKALAEKILPKDLSFKDLTPDMRMAYDLATQQVEAFSPEQQDRKRLQAALKMGGGRLSHFHDQGEFWSVEWTTSTGEWYSSAIAKADLTVLGAGICLDGGDRNFDLQSLVGVVEQQRY